MKRISLVVLTLLLAGWTAAAQAQSSVTLYGIVDTSIRYLRNSAGEASAVEMVSGANSGSRWGMRGSEDLGQGLKAVFVLENGFDSVNGKFKQGGREFGRQAYAGLAGESWGRVTMGRQYDPLSDLVQPLQSNGFLGGFFSTPGDVDNADNSARISNSLKWTSPTWGGFTVVALYGVGGVTGSLGSGQTYSGAVSYNAGSLGLAAGFTHIDNGNPTLSTRGVSSADAFFGSAVNSAYASASSIDIARVAGDYVIGPVRLGAYYSFSQYRADAKSTFTGSEKYHNVAVFGVWQVSPFLVAELGFDYLRTLGNSSAKYHQAAFGLDYLISKRTDVYGILAYNHASGSNGQGAAQAVIGSVNVNSGKRSQTLATIGLRHRF